MSKLRVVLVAFALLAANQADAQIVAGQTMPGQAFTAIPPSGPLSLTVPTAAQGSLNPLQPRSMPQAMAAPAQAGPAGIQPPSIGFPGPGQGLPPPPALNTPPQDVSASDLATITVTAIMDGAAVLRTATNSYQVADKGMLSHNGRLYGVRVKEGVVTLFDRNQRQVFEATVGSGVSPEQRFSWTRSQSSSSSGAGSGAPAPSAAPIKTP